MFTTLTHQRRQHQIDSEKVVDKAQEILTIKIMSK